MIPAANSKLWLGGGGGSGGLGECHCARWSGVGLPGRPDGRCRCRHCDIVPEGKRKEGKKDSNEY